MTGPRLLDLFCGAGGCARGYQLAGFHVTGVDINPQPRYAGDEFIQADAMTYPLDGFDAIHASPPCQRYSVTRHTHNVEYPDLLGPVRDRLTASGVPWVIENVEGAPMPNAITLCGAAFGLNAYDPVSDCVLWLKRHRLFESSEYLMSNGCQHRGKEIGGVYGGGPSNRNPSWKRGGYTPAAAVRRELMDIDWMTNKELNESIPPAYCEFIGEQLLQHLKAAA